MGMTDFDRTLTSLNMQDEHAQTISQNWTGIINATAFSKVKEALVNAFAAPVLAYA